MAETCQNITVFARQQQCRHKGYSNTSGFLEHSRANKGLLGRRLTKFCYNKYEPCSVKIEA